MRRAARETIVCGLIADMSIESNNGGCVSRTGNEEAKEKTNHPARRASDSPHPFKPADGFRTCGICGLKETHKIHHAEDSGK
jgi:hypothetical protein